MVSLPREEGLRHVQLAHVQLFLPLLPPLPMLASSRSTGARVAICGNVIAEGLKGRRAIDSEMTACGDDGRLCWKGLVMAGKEGTHGNSGKLGEQRRPYPKTSSSRAGHRW